MMRSLRCTLPLSLFRLPAVLTLLVGLLPAVSQAQPLPVARLDFVFPPGGQVGSTLEVAIGGADLDDASRLLFSHPGITAEPVMRDPGEFEQGPQRVPNQFKVTIKPDVPTGIYEVWAVGLFGVSNPRRFAAMELPEAVEAEPNNQTDQATVVEVGGVVNGRSDGTTPDVFKFTAKRGQRILIEGLAQRIDSRMDVSLSLSDASGKVLHRARETYRFDPLIDFTVPADGDYFVEVFDFLYRGGNEYFYRLALRTGPRIDFIFPPAGLPGSNDKYTVYGRNLPGGANTDLVIDGQPLQRLEAQIALPADPMAQQRLDSDGLIYPQDAGIDGLGYRVRSPQGTSNAVTVSYATAPVVAEQEPNNEPAKAQAVTPPCEVVGQFHPRGDVDWVTFEAKKGDTYRIEVFSQRLGLPTDPFLLVQRVTVNDEGEEQVSEISAMDDPNPQQANIGGADFNTSTDDPEIRFTAPEDGKYRILVRDLYSDTRGDPRLVYRLAIRAEKPDYRLVAMPRFPAPAQNNQPTGNAGVLVRRGGAAGVDVMAFRTDGFNEPITVTAEGLPQGVTCDPVVLGPGQNGVPLVFRAAENAADWVGPVKITGTAKLGDQELKREARAAAKVWPGAQNMPTVSRLAQNVMLAVGGEEPVPFSVALGDGKPLEMSRSGKLEVPIKVARRGDFKANIVLAPIGLPANVALANVTINGDQTEGKAVLDIKNNAPLGTFTIALFSDVQVSRERNPLALKTAQAEKENLAKVVTQLTEEQKKAQAAKQEADKAATEAEAKSKQAATAAEAAAKALADAEAAAKAAAEKAQQAAKAAADAPDNKELADAKAAADKAAADAAAAVKTAAEAKQKADAEAKAAVEAAQKAAEAKAAADKAATEADAKLKRGQTAQQNLDKQIGELAKKANFKIHDLSTTLTFSIAPAPFSMKVQPPAAAIKQGAKGEVTVDVQRLFGYDGPVQLQLALPNGVQDVKITNVNLEKGQNQVKIAVEAGPKATPGTHTLSLKGTANFGGSNLQLDETVNVTIEAVEQAAEK